MAGCEDEYSEGLFEIMEENFHFIECFNRYESVEAFLKREEHMYGRAVTVNAMEEEVFLKYSLDIDGCVVELKSLQGVKLPLRHLTLLPHGLMSVRNIYSMLNKHMDLSLYSEAELSNFRRSVGIQLFYEHGWEGWLGLIPRVGSGHPEVLGDVLKERSFQYFKEVKTTFALKLKTLCIGSLARRTLMKNNLNHIDKMCILPDDCSAILQTLQDNLDECPLLCGFRLLIMCFRFGEKSSCGVDLKVFDKNEVIRVTVHSAINIESDFMDLFWSRSGLQEIVGSRGMLYTCASFSDCANYRSNLDGKAIDISNRLRSVCYEMSKLRFVQLYTDLPHRRPVVRFHPVSGCIVGGLVFPKQTSEAFERDANKYLSALDSNFHLMQRSTCRLECVTELAKWAELVKASDCLNVDKVFELLRITPLLVPFPLGTVKCIHDVGLALTTELKRLLETYSGTANVEATWKAYQLELSAEKMLWGYPLCTRSKQYSVSLGPGSVDCTRSKTDYLGFLALERWTACMLAENSIPPCKIWSYSDVVGRKILRTAGIHDVLNSSNIVLGRRLFDIIVEDLFDVGRLETCMRYEEYKRELFSKTPSRLRVNGAVTVKQLVRLLTTKRRMSVRMTYGNVCQLLRENNIDLETVLKDGLVHMKIEHFPALDTYDRHRNATMNWSLRCGLWKIIGHAEYNSESSIATAALTMLVISELERRKLVFVSKLKKLPNSLPWIRVSAQKLHSLKLPEESLVIMLSFVSCVALMKNGWFIEYEGIERLVMDMPVDQYQLQALEIQSKLLFKNFRKNKLFRLHHTIPWKVPVVEERVTNKKEAEMEIEDKEDVREVQKNKISEEEEIMNVEEVSFRVPTSLPKRGATRQRWTSMEIEILYEVARGKTKDNSFQSLYHKFRQKCIDQNIPFRTFSAFKNKFVRL